MPAGIFLARTQPDPWTELAFQLVKAAVWVLPPALFFRKTLTAGLGIERRNDPRLALVAVLGIAATGAAPRLAASP